MARRVTLGVDVGDHARDSRIVASWRPPAARRGVPGGNGVPVGVLEFAAVVV